MERGEENKRFMVRQWEELRKAGGVTLSIEQIEEIMNQEVGKVLDRETVMKKVLGYFATCLETVEDGDTGEKVSTWKRNPTKGGLALALGIDKQTLLDMVKNKNSAGNPYSSVRPDKKRIIAVEDFDILQKAYAMIEEFYESQLGLNKNNAGVMYWLNNSNNSKWSNEQEFKFGTAEHNDRSTLTAEDLPQLGSANKGCITKQPLPILKNDE